MFHALLRRGSVSSPLSRTLLRRLGSRAAEGDVVTLLSTKLNRLVLQLKKDQKYNSISHNDIMGQSFGSVVYSRKGCEAHLLLQPSLEDFLRSFSRATQVIYEKDAAYVIHRLGLHSGSKVVEAGTGSGRLTAALAYHVMPEGRVFTYEARDDHHKTAEKNLSRTPFLQPFVTTQQRNVEKEGFDVTDCDAVVLDVRAPELCLQHVRNALKVGGHFACVLPTTNQVSDLVSAMELNGFVDIDVVELLMRKYKPVPERLRPEDIMFGHSVYMVFGRTAMMGIQHSQWWHADRQNFLAKANERRQKAAQVSEMRANILPDA